MTALSIFSRGFDAPCGVFRRNPGGTWSKDLSLPGLGGTVLHPSLTFDRLGRLDLAWLEVSPQVRIRFARRTPSGVWSKPQTVASGAQTLPLRPGMSVNADILQEKRKVWEWVFEPILSLKERLG